MKSNCTRREFLKGFGVGAAAVALSSCNDVNGLLGVKSRKRPNILLAISDDQSWPYAGAYGCKFVKTPAFDRVAKEGVLFTHAYCPAPQCSPARAALLTGRNIWQLEEAGTHSSYFPRKFKVYTELLEQSGYHVGNTAKAWGPGNYRDSGWDQNPAGKGYNQRKLKPPTRGMNNLDYAGNFEDFLQARPEGAPFCFWYGATEPHRSYEEGVGKRRGKNTADAEVPAFLPDTELVRSDLLDYAVEIEWFDTHLGRMINKLEEIGELENTLVVVTGDNGMPFPRAKANLYDKGTHVPLAICWADRITGGREVEDFVSFIDFAPTFLEAAGLTPLSEMTGRSLMKILLSEKRGWVDSKRCQVFTGRERHTHARPDNLAYPARAIQTKDYLYIWNMKPDRWPAGDPDGEGGYYDIDSCPSKTYLLENLDKPSVKKYFDLSCAKRPEEELYDMKEDKDCMHNLAEDSRYAAIKHKLRAQLAQTLSEQGDPRVLGYGDIIESYPRFNRMRSQFPGFAERGKYNLKYREKAEKARKKKQGAK